MIKRLLAVLILISTAVFASTFSGKIVDAKTGEPLPAANVQILGTLRGASADANGEFQVLNLPPGTFSVRASMIGYKSQTIENVKVLFKRTATVDFKLEETTIEFDPIVVLAGKSKQRLDQAPVSISVVSSRDIERRNAVNLIEALESAPGVSFVGDQISIRGSTGYTFGAGNKVLLLLDGVPVYSSDSGQFNWDMLPPLDIEQIEVLKGAGSTLWGASALGGVVNIITKDPSPEGALLYSFSAGKYDKPYYSEWEWTDPNRLFYLRQDVSFSKRFKKFGMRVSGGRFISTGYTQIGDFQKYNLTGKFDYRFNGGIKWTGYAAYSFIDKGFFVQWLGQNDPYQVDESNLMNYAATNQLNAYMKVAIPFSSRFGINIRGSFVRTLMGNQFGDSADFNPALGQGMEIQADWIPYPGHLVTFGTQFQLDAGSTRYFGDHKGYFVGPYVQDEWKAMENLRITTGFRYDRYQLVGDLKEDLFSPRFGINWQPWEKTTLRGSVGSGFRAATIVERFLELSIMNFKIKANPELKAESSWAYDVGLRQYISDDWNIDLSFFDNEYSELIEAHLDLIRGLVQFRNIPKARIRGIEATMNMNFPLELFGYDFAPGIKTSITALDHEDLQWHEPLTYRPNIISSAKLILKPGKVNLQINYRYGSKIEEVKIYPINDRVAMHFVDVQTSYDFGPVALQFGVNNLFQYNYAPMESNLLPMRTFTAGLKGGF